MYELQKIIIYHSQPMANNPAGGNWEPFYCKLNPALMSRRIATKFYSYTEIIISYNMCVVL